MGYGLAPAIGRCHSIDGAAQPLPVGGPLSCPGRAERDPGPNAKRAKLNPDVQQPRSCGPGARLALASRSLAPAMGRGARLAGTHGTFGLLHRAMIGTYRMAASPLFSRLDVLTFAVRA